MDVHYRAARWPRGRHEAGDSPIARSRGTAGNGSHPLAKRIGAWPAVAVVTAVTVAAAELVTRTAAR